MTENKLKTSMAAEDRRREFSIVLLIFVVGGVFGFVYEELFYLVNDYIKFAVWRWEKRGNTFGPWIQIYGIGGVFIYLCTRKLAEKPLLVFLVSGLLCGTLEFLTGLFFDKCMGGTRYWDYNVEIWNFGNINGYVCLRSVLFFALSGLILLYIICPLLRKAVKRIETKTLMAISVSLAALCLADMAAGFVYHNFIVK